MNGNYDVDHTTSSTASPVSTLNRMPPTRQPYLAEVEFGRSTSDSRGRMQRNLDEMDRRIAAVTAAARHRMLQRDMNTEANRGTVAAAASTSSYAERDSHQQSLYNWAAMEEENEEEESEAQGETDGWRDLEEALSRHRRTRNLGRVNGEMAEEMEALRRQRDLYIRRRSQQGVHSITAGVEWRREEERRREERRQEERRREERITSLIEGGQGQRLRHRASRERILRAMEAFMVEREREMRSAGLSGEESRTGDTSATRRGVEERSGVQLHGSERAMELVKASRRHTSVRVRTMFEYLSRVRECNLDNVDDTAALAKELDIARVVGSDDIVAETWSIQPPPSTSLLTTGSMFTGSQHAPHDASGVHLLNRDRDYLRRMVANRNLSSAHLPASIATLADAELYLLEHPSTSRHTSTMPLRPPHRIPDHWPVSVTLHSVDMEKLSVTGTMSANHIPDKFAPTSPDHKPDGSSMKSYFEGEIIDMNKFTLETETYKNEGVAVDIETDVEYWRQLGPFREEVERATQDVTKPVDAQFKADVRLAACLGSLHWVKQVIGQEWILMRWKERCFLPPSESNSWGLTISGFYYVAMRRDTGRIEGLYYDPGSQPYQKLDLVPTGSRSIRSSENPSVDTCVLGAGGVRKWFPSVDFGSER